MTTARWLVLAAAAFAGCNKEDPSPDHRIDPVEVDLGPMAYDDGEQPWTPVTILNTTFFTIYIEEAEITGDWKRYVELQALGDSEVDIPLRQSATLYLRVTKPEPAMVPLWDGGAYEVSLDVTIGGTGKSDPATGEPDRGAWVSETEHIPVSFSLMCDHDGDGDEAEDCGGDDCDDHLVTVSSLSLEICDGADNNCNGVEDDDCLAL